MALAALKEELDTWDAALQAFDSNDFAGALRRFEDIADTSKIVANMGLIYLYSNQLQLAIEKLSLAVKMDHYFAAGYFLRGTCQFHLNNFEQAAQDFCDAEIMMRGNNFINYEELGLQFTLYAAEVLYNRGLALARLGRKGYGSTFLRRASSCRVNASHDVIDQAVDEQSIPFTIPTGLLFRPSPSKRKFLLDYEASASTSKPTLSTAPVITQDTSFSPGPKSDASSTCAPSIRSSVASRKWSLSSFRHHRKVSSTSSNSEVSSSSSQPLRSDLNKVMGSDLTVPSTEISTIPCAGVRIESGKLTGLMAWRFVVVLDESDESLTRRQKQKQRHWKDVPRPAIVSNFILDTGCSNTLVSQDMLRALRFKGSYRPGSEVSLRIQDVQTKCVVARLGEASRLGGQFMTAGSLTFYFDTKLNAPVLYVGDETNERPTNIPRTVAAQCERKQRRMSLRDSVTSWMSALNLMKVEA